MIDTLAKFYEEKQVHNWDDPNWQYVQSLVHECLDDRSGYDEDVLHAYLETMGYFFSVDFDDIDALDSYIEKNQFTYYITSKEMIIATTKKKFILIVDIGGEIPIIH